MYKILIVGGTFNEEYNDSDKSGYIGRITKNDYEPNRTREYHSLQHTYGKQSGLISKFIDLLIPYSDDIVFHNGGKYSDLQSDLNNAKNFDIVFWFANVDNSLPKVRDVKEVAPKVMLVTSKRNDNEKYTTMEVVQRALAAKANLIFEFSKLENGTFNSRVLDPLGNLWYNGTDLELLIKNAMDRLAILKNITRQGTILKSDNKKDALTDFDITEDDINCEQLFVDIVKDYAEDFHNILNPGPNVKRFLGNCSMRPKSTRCAKGFPSFRKNNLIYVSQRNVDKEFLTLDNFVPTYIDENDVVYYYGETKPSVDTPVQLRLYNMFPNINYMIHAHVYARNAYMSINALPCGALEEIDDINNTVKLNNLDYNGTKYVFNLKGHGCIIMGATIEDVKDILYYGRPMPENQNNG